MSDLLLVKRFSWNRRYAKKIRSTNIFSSSKKTFWKKLKTDFEMFFKWFFGWWIHNYLWIFFWNIDFAYLLFQGKRFAANPIWRRWFEPQAQGGGHWIVFHAPPPTDTPRRSGWVRWKAMSMRLMLKKIRIEKKFFFIPKNGFEKKSVWFCLISYVFL